MLEAKKKSGRKHFSTFNEAILWRAKISPDKIAVTQLNEACEEVSSYTYKDLIANSIKISEQLLKNHSKGDRCLIAISAGIEFISAFLGCLFAGIIAVPTLIPKKNKQNDRFKTVFYNSKPTCIITTSDTKELIAAQISSLTDIKEKPSIITVSMDETNYNQDIHPKVDSDDIAFLQYTSGSVSFPKGIMVSQGNLLHNSETIKHSYNHTEDLVGVSWLPPFHDMGLIGCILQPLYMGGSFFLIKPSDFIRNPALWFKAISKYKGATVGCPNFALDYCIEKIKDPDVNTMDLSSIKVMFCGSEPVREETLNKFSDKFGNLNFKSETFLPCYGLAEATLMVCGINHTEKPQYFHADTDSLEKNNFAVNAQKGQKYTSYTSCGKTSNKTDLIIVNPKTKNEISETLIGEIWVKNNSVCKGYWNDPTETERSFRAYTTNNNKGPFLRTGDLGFIKDQNVYVTGRLKDLIIIRGLNFFPSDIENIVDKCHPSLQPNSCAAFSINNENNEKLVIVQEIKRSHFNNYNKDEIFNSIIKAVSDSFGLAIHSIVIIRPMSIPKTSSGKIKRQEIKNLFLKDKLNIVISNIQNENLPENLVFDKGSRRTEDIAMWIQNWLGKKLAIDPKQIDINQPILSSGLDSIGAVELECDINNTFNTNIFVGDFLENNSIVHIAEAGIIDQEK